VVGAVSPRAVDKRARPGNEGVPASGPTADLTAVGALGESPAPDSTTGVEPEVPAVMVDQETP
jgi:hypothetical protein